jgi:hypothetical protein
MDIVSFDVDVAAGDDLRQVRVEKDAVFRAKRANFADWLEGANLIVCRHNGYKRRVLSHCCLDITDVDASCLIDWKVGDAPALALKGSCWFENCRMLDRTGDDVALFRECSRDTEKRHIVGFGAASRKDDLVRAGLQRSGNLGAPMFNSQRS